LYGVLFVIASVNGQSQVSLRQKRASYFILNTFFNEC